MATLFNGRSLGRQMDVPTTIYEDNQVAIELAKNAKYHNQTKHVDICHHFNRAIKSSVSTLGHNYIKEITSLQRKVILGFLKGRDTFACLPTGYGKSLIYDHLSPGSTSSRRVICCLQLQGSLLYTSG